MVSMIPEVYIDQLLVMALNDMGLPRKRGRPRKGQQTYTQILQRELITNAVETAVQAALTEFVSRLGVMFDGQNTAGSLGRQFGSRLAA